MDITYLVRKVGGHSKRDPSGKAGREHRGMGCWGIGGCSPLKLGELESVEPDTVISTTEEEVTRVGANDELPGEVVNIPGESEYRSCLADMA